MLKDFTKEKFDILIQAGQSNSEGYGFGSVEEPYQPNDLIWYMNDDFTMSIAAEKVNGNEIQSTYALSFAQEYLRDNLLQTGRKLLILRTSVGGTGFSDHRWNMSGDLYLRMMEMIRTALALNEENRIVGFLWHQGETDALNNVIYEVHYDQLRGLLRSVCEEFDVPEMPFIAGDFVQHWASENMEIAFPIVKAIRDVCSKYGHGAFVETDGLLSNSQELGRWTLGWDDNIHFSRKSVYVLGKRYFEAYKDILSKKIDL